MATTTTTFFRQALLTPPQSKWNRSRRGKKIPFVLAEGSMIKYVSVMSEHGFRTETGRPVPCEGLLSRQITVSEEFIEEEVTQFLAEARAAFAVSHPGRTVLTRLTFGIYTDELLNHPALNLSPEEIDERRERMTIFIVPYVLPIDSEMPELKAMVPGAEKIMFFGPGDYVYDFGGLQP